MDDRVDSEEVGEDSSNERCTGYSGGKDEETRRMGGRKRQKGQLQKSLFQIRCPGER